MVLMILTTAVRDGQGSRPELLQFARSAHVAGAG